MGRVILFCLLFLGVVINSHSQKFEWVKSFGGSGGENNPLCIQTKDGNYLTWLGVSNTSLGVFTKKQKYPTIACVGKLDNNGKPLWLWASDSVFGPIQFNSIVSDSISENIYITGALEGIVYFGNESYHSYYSQSKNKYSRNGFVMKMNKYGTPIKFSVIQDTNYNRVYDIKIYDSKLVIPVGFGASLNQKFCGLKSKCYTNGGFVLCVLDTNLNIINSSKLINIPEYNFLNEQLNINNDKIILTTYATNISYRDSLIDYKDSSSSGYFSISLDKSLAVKRIDKLFSGTILKASSAVTEKGEIIVGTAFFDSIIFRNKTITSNQNGKPIVLIFNTNYEIEYATYPSTSVSSSSSQILTLEYHNGYVYIGGRIQGDFKFGDIITYEREGRVFLAKLDLFGSFLWAKRFATSKKYNSLDDISAFNKKIIGVGVFNDTANLDSQQFISNGSIDLLVAKIHDIEITRGYVSKGSYCAGDTIKIPYTKNGTFNKGNQFIAQLSDENGNFEGKERELGRLTSDTSGVIKGLLPMFNIESSPHYRIRILSTNPVVQSYYKYDTLRLLIYSKDTANAGKDTTICQGKTVKLTTTGGSRWHWSPGNLVQDSTAKTTLAFPNKTTKYRIIISDSSGCGKIDTAYKTITVRPPLEIKGLPKDTTVCKDSRPIFKLIPSGGLGSGFTYQWLSSFNQPLGNSDTFSLKVSTPENIKAVLTDGCTLESDTTMIKLTVPLPIAAKIEKPECFDSSVTLKISGTGGYKNSLNYIWYKDNKAIDIGKTTTLSSITKKQWMEAYTTDFCKTTVKDSIHLFPNPKAKLLASTDSVCQFQPIVLFNQSVHFNPIQSALNGFRWKNKDSSLTYTQTGQQIISLQITDSLGCKDNASVSIMVVEKPNAQFVIIPENPTVDNGTIELTPLETNYKKYNWAISDNLRLYHKSWQSVRLPIFDTATYQATLMVSNSFGCVDTVTKLIKIGVSDAFYIPNAVSNNEDGLNDEFAPFGWKVQSYTMLVVARTNQVVFKGNTPWKPTYEDGVYSYVIKVKFKDGTENTFKGHVHVIH
jgi:hypothetical protein